MNEAKKALNISFLNKEIILTLTFLFKIINKIYAHSKLKLPKKRNSLPIVKIDTAWDTKAFIEISILSPNDEKLMKEDWEPPLDGIIFPVIFKT